MVISNTTTVYQLGSLLAIAKGVLHPPFPVAFCLPGFANRHIQSTEVVLELKVNGTLRGRKSDGLYDIRKRNLVYFGNVLGRMIGQTHATPFDIDTPVVRNDSRTLAPLHLDGHANRDCGFRGRNGSVRHLVRKHQIDIFRCQGGKHALVWSFCRLFARIKDSLD